MKYLFLYVMTATAVASTTATTVTTASVTATGALWTVGFCLMCKLHIRILYINLCVCGIHDLAVRGFLAA